MAELDNARRSLNRAVYTPIGQRAQRTPPTPSRPLPERALDKATAIASMHVLPNELDLVRRTLRGNAARSTLRLVDLVERTTAPGGEPAGTAARLGGLSAFATVADADIIAFGEALADVRAKRHQEATALVAEIERHINQAPAPPGKDGVTITPPKELTADASFFNPALPGATLFRAESTKTVKGGLLGDVRKGAPGRTAGGAGAERASTSEGAAGLAKVANIGTEFRANYFVEIPRAAPPAQALTTETLPFTVGTVHQLVATGTLPPAIGGRIAALAGDLGIQATVQQLTTTLLVNMLKGRVDVVGDAVYAYTRRAEIEPSGYLHLERITFTPAGIERGELVHSVPLTPAEEVNITHKEWSNTSEEFERIVTDYLEGYSEEGVTEKTELAQAINSQQQHSSGFNMSVSASGGYGPVSISASAGYNVADSSTRSEQFSRNESNEITRKASVRTKKEHKVSFKVASASGTEDQQVRTIKNPFPDRSARVDYYQLLRRWRVDLYRYGVRLTYDLTIPEPGSDILSKIVEIRALEAALSEGFAAPDASLPWARFNLQPNQVTRNNFEVLAAVYGAAVEVPPAATIRLVRAFSKQWGTFDESKRAETTPFSVDVAADYRVVHVDVRLFTWPWEDREHAQAILTDARTWIGASGQLTLNVFSWQLASLSVDVQLTAALRPEVYDAWQMRAWGVLRDAAQARYEANRANLKARLAQLQEELGAQDALTLRQIEREEVSKGVLRWMFGPSFTFTPADLPADLYRPDGSVAGPEVWSRALAQGEVITFLHHAIEWENMLYFLYPYFWSHSSRWELKKYLDHPDFMHRTFLRSGSARVVLTIRPGFVRPFLSYVEAGAPDAIPPDHPYLTIAEELEAFARTNYPGIRPANPVEGARPLLTPLQKRAWGDMQAIIAALEAHKTAHGRYPTTAEGLAALSPAVPTTDPWGNPFDYRSPGLLADFELVSFGSDGVPGGDDEAADITSWAEASLIGRWFEYTPTGALDVAFGETLPSA